jgi:hypothetical protein
MAAVVVADLMPWLHQLVDGRAKMLISTAQAEVVEEASTIPITSPMLPQAGVPSDAQ